MDTLSNTNPKPAQIAILMTCFNRCETTLACLQVLFKQKADFEVYLVDDGSSDGTAERVKAQYPSIHVLQGDGSLFWVGGMRMAFAEALKTSHAYYLWLNDDTLLRPEAIQTLLKTHQDLAENHKADSIVVGSVADPTTGKQTYGGRNRPNRWYSFKFRPVEPNSEAQECDTMQGNIVLIPHSVARKLGNVDAAFIHTFGDLDYGLRAQKADCAVWVAPGVIGTCPQNSVRGSYVDTNLPVSQRLKQAFHKKGFPLGAWTTYLRRHSGPFWFIYVLLPYIRAVIGYRNIEDSPSFCED